MNIRVFTKDHCQPCKLTRRKLTELGLEYTELDAREHVDQLAALGYTSAPVVTVVTDDGKTLSWSGYSPDNIKALVGRD